MYPIGANGGSQAVIDRVLAWSLARRSADELAAFSGAYRATTLQDVAALNARASLSP